MEGSQPRPGIYLPQKTTESLIPENKSVARAVIRSKSSDYLLSVKKTGPKSSNPPRPHSNSLYWSYKQIVLSPQFTGSLNRSSVDSTPPARSLELRLSAKVTETPDTILPSVLSPISSNPPGEGAPAIEQPESSLPAHHLRGLQEELDLAGKDKVPVPDISPDEIRARLARLEGKTLSEQSKAEFAKIQLEVQSLKSFLQKMDQVLGNLTKQEELYIHELNYAIGRTGLNPMFHHGADNNNPVSDLDTNFPLTVVLPRFIEPLKERYYIIEDGKQLKAFINLLKDNSYYAPTNPAWGSIHSVRGKSFRRYSSVTGEPMIPMRH